MEGFYKIPADLGNALDKPLDAFRNKKLFDFGFNEPSKIEMHDNGKTYSLQKTGDKWFSNGKEQDSTSVQSLIDKLRDLSATQFADSGFTTPTMDVSVTSSEGKRVEKVLLAKGGAGYIAQRENEPSLYELDAKTVDDLSKAAGDVKPAQAAEEEVKTPTYDRPQYGSVPDDDGGRLFRFRQGGAIGDL